MAAHTPIILPTIHTTDGSTMTISQLGSIFAPYLSISIVFQVPQLISTRTQILHLEVSIKNPLKISDTKHIITSSNHVINL